MNAKAEQTTMSHKLTPARQNEILSRCQWTPGGKVRVQSTHRTDPLLIAAGVLRPRPLETYQVNVRRDSSGFLVIDHDSHAPQAENDTGLFAPGGIFAGQAPPADTVTPGIPPGFFAETLNTMRIRRFEIPVGSTRLRVEILAYDDQPVASPSENQRFTPREARDAEIRAAALRITSEFARLER